MLSPEEHDRIAEEQGYVCAICGKPESVVNRRLAEDHDHETDEFRGLLCGRCNTLLGLAGDEPLILQAAIGYLSREKPRVNTWVSRPTQQCAGMGANGCRCTRKVHGERCHQHQ